MIPIPISTRRAFFTGKGGVGKTALACATAIRSPTRQAGPARQHRPGLEPRRDARRRRCRTTRRRSRASPGLLALNIDPETAADDVPRARDRAVPRHLDASSRSPSSQEQLAGACTVEIAAFDEFAGLLAGDEATAPSTTSSSTRRRPGTRCGCSACRARGRGFLRVDHAQGASCLGPHSGLKMQQSRFAAALAALADRSAHDRRAGDAARSRRAARGRAHVRRARGARASTNQQLVDQRRVRGDATDAIAVAARARGARARGARRRCRRACARCPSMRVPLRAFNMVGLPALRALLDDRRRGRCARRRPPAQSPQLPPLVVADRRARGAGPRARHGDGQGRRRQDDHRRRDRRGAGVARAPGAPEHDRSGGARRGDARRAGRATSTVSRIDPGGRDQGVRRQRDGDARREARRRRARAARRGPALAVLRGGRGLRGVLADRLARRARSFVVLDTAPTGHTLLLLDATGAYHRQIVAAATRRQHAGRIVTPLMRLRDPDVHEGAARDARRDDARLRGGAASGRSAARARSSRSHGSSTAASPPPARAIPCSGSGSRPSSSRSSESSATMPTSRHRPVDDRGAGRPRTTPRPGPRRDPRARSPDATRRADRRGAITPEPACPSAHHELRLEPNRRRHRGRHKTGLSALLQDPQCAVAVRSLGDRQPWAQHDLGEAGDLLLPVHDPLARELERSELDLRGLGDGAEGEEEARLDGRQHEMLGSRRPRGRHSRGAART